MKATHRTMKQLALCVLWLFAWSPIGAVRAQSSGGEAESGSGAPEPLTYGARARVKETSSIPTQPTEAESAALQADLGASFSLAESLPGSLPVFSGVPYLIVRGATPAGTATYYDGVAIPSLYHIALGPSVVNPRLLGKLSFHAGVSPARYGRHIGGTLAAEAPRSVASRTARRELELTLLDASGFLYVPEIRTAVAWRIGDPGLLMNLLGLDATLNYYDYQVRHESTLGERTELVLLGLGGGDQLGDRTAPEDDIGLDFHRWLGRITHRMGATTFGSQLVFGYDTSTLGLELDGEGFRASPSVYVEHRFDGVRLRTGAELLSTHVSLRRRETRSTSEGAVRRGQSLSLNPEDFLDGQPYAGLPARSVWAVYNELELRPTSRLTIELGARGDMWLAGSETEAAFGPSGRVRYELASGVALHAAIGLTHQARGSPVPLPSLTDVSIDAGLERALQAEVGGSVQVLPDLQLEATYFHHRFDDVVYLELILDCEGNTDPEAARRALVQGMVPLCRDAGLPVANGLAQGLELYLKRDLTARISGFVSYTLSFAEATARDGTQFTPQSDVRHLANAVVRFDLGAGFAVGARLHYRTGKMAVNTLYDGPRMRFERAEARLPAFFRADLRGSYTWEVAFGRMEASIGVQNVTASSEATNRDCLVDPTGDWSGSSVPIICTVDYQRAILLPNLGIRAEM